MLTARLFTRRSTRVVAFSIIVAGALTVAASFVTRTRACPAPPPQPLRVLYMKSDLIVVARIGKTEQVEVDKENESRLMKTALEVSSTLKGETVGSVVYVYEWTWGPDENPIASAGSDPVLFFLVRREDGDGYEVDDISYGLKKLPDADLTIYVKRIEELARILKQEKPDQAEIVEWLVRLAEDPVTRWEGAYELSASNYALHAKNENKAEAEGDASDQADGEEAIPEQDVVSYDESGAPIDSMTYEDDYENDGTFVSLLTSSQKERLASALFNSQTIGNGEIFLINLVKDWNDSRLPSFLLSRLQTVADNSPYYAPELMRIVADTIGDQALVDLVEDYRMQLYNGEEEYDQNKASGTEEATSEQVESRTSRFKQHMDARVEHFVALAQSSAPK